jgi:N-succinyldiaminopimelate aminotransferase
MPTYARRVSGFGTTIFTEINELAREHKAVNLGQGMPDFDGPQVAIDAAVEALRSGTANQYAPGPGIPELRQGIARHSQAFYNLDIDPVSGVLVTPGATEAVYCSIMGLVDPGDEVIIIEPFFDSYPPGVIMANAKPVYVALHPPDWTLDPDELRAAFKPHTRAIIINTPHNPTGRVFTREELTLIADLAKEFDVLVISDEVYEHLIYDDARHIPIATLPDMFERTVTIGSAGKTFGMTGWKVGWVYGPPELVTGVWRSHQFTTFATNHPAQRAVAHAFTLGSSYYEEYQTLYSSKRDLMMQALDAAGLKSITPQGTYFVMADFSEVFKGDDVEHLTRDHVRFAFCKSDATLQEAGERMAKLRR